MAEVGTQAQQHGNGVNDVFSNQFGMIMIDELYEAMFSLCFGTMQWYFVVFYIMRILIKDFFLC